MPGSAPRRNHFLAKGIAEKVDASYILTATPEPDASLPRTEARFIPAWDYRRLIRRRTRDGALPEDKKNSPIAQWLIRLINSFPFSVILGEGGWRYYRRLVREGRKLVREKQITHLYSSYRPFVDHYAAYQLKKKYPHLIWIADFRDLIIDPHFMHILFPNAHHRLFQKIFSHADVLTTVSDGLAVHVEKYNPSVRVVRNAVSDTWTPPVPIHAEKFTLVYTGSMFLDKRNAWPLFEVVKSLIDNGKVNAEDIRIVYAGKDGVLWESMAKTSGLESLLDNRGIISGRAAQDIQERACINVLLTVSSEKLQGYLTGKMIEYFESGSPLLGIASGQRDPELEKLFAALSIGRCFSDQPEDRDAIGAFILAEYRAWQNSLHNRKPLDAETFKTNYSVDAVMAPMMHFIDRDVHHSGNRS